MEKSSITLTPKRKSILQEALNRLLHVLAKLAFPSSLRCALHRWRGVDVGKNVFIATGVYIDDKHPEMVRLGDGCFITAHSILLVHQRDLTGYGSGKWIGNQKFKVLPIIIGRGAHVGVGAIIMPGVTLGEGAVIGAGSVVTRDIPPYCIAVGTPAKVIRDLRTDTNHLKN